MNLSRIDRNRLTVVALLTLVTLPLLWIASAGEDSGTETTVDSLAPTTTIALGIVTDLDADAPVNLDGPQVESPTGTGQIAYPANNDGQMDRGIATYKRFPDVAKTGCATNVAPLGAVVTVRNLNNGRKVECTNLNIGYIPPNVDLVLHTELFEDIGELKEAPLPVEMSW